MVLTMTPKLVIIIVKFEIGWWAGYRSIFVLGDSSIEVCNWRGDIAIKKASVLVLRICVYSIKLLLSIAIIDKFIPLAIKLISAHHFKSISILLAIGCHSWQLSWWMIIREVGNIVRQNWGTIIS